MARARQLTKSVSGSYYNSSQWVFDTVQYVTDVSVIAMKNEDILIHPNPTTNLITNETSFPGMYNINIKSINGQLLMEKVMVGTDSKIDLSTFKSGVYFITVRSTDFAITRKIIKI